MLRRFLIAAALAVVLTPSAHAATPHQRLGLAEIRQADGTLVRRADLGPFVYPDDGSALAIGSSSASARGVELRDVSILGGRVRVARLFVPAQGLKRALIDGLVVDGFLQDAGANDVISLAGPDYLVVFQQAVVPGVGKRSSGVVGLRVYLGAPYGKLPAGTQILVGLARAAPRQAVDHGRASMPWAVLGLDQARVPGLRSTPEPFLVSPFGGQSSTGGRAVLLAEQFLGTPYVWGGADPVSGFDCSGLVMYVYGQLGISLPHFTGYQWNMGRRLPQSEPLQPGDIVFFHMHSYGPGHEGMYIGGGRFIHAPHTGDVVRISSLMDPGYALGYVGAVRVT
jgi:cell wall-associated NlpC family hydrolase